MSIVSDLDVPIAIRIGIGSCTKYPHANYMSYQKLSDNHKAFTSRINDLLVSWSIHEALENPN